MRSEEMDEELVDYDGDYELTEQEKAEMEPYEKELADQEENEQRAHMALLEKKIEERTQQLGPVMNFTKGATSNMNEDVLNEESEEEITKELEEKQVSGKMKEGGDKTGTQFRGYHNCFGEPQGSITCFFLYGNYHHNVLVYLDDEK
jgi:hypothetical protein